MIKWLCFMLFTSWFVFQLVVYFGNWDSNRSKILQIFWHHVKFPTALPLIMLVAMLSGVFMTLFIILLMKWRNNEYGDDMNF